MCRLPKLMGGGGGGGASASVVLQRMILQLLALICMCHMGGSQTAGGDAELQEIIEGIGGLMRRFEDMQPRLSNLPQADLQVVATGGQRLHERFLALQQEVTAVPNPDAGRIITFHADLAEFVAHVEDLLGVEGPGSQGNVGAGSLPAKSAPGAGAAAAAMSRPLSGIASGVPSGPKGAPSRIDLASAGGFGGRAMAPPETAAGVEGAIRPATDQRLQVAMGSIMQGMQKFEAMHVRLQRLPPAQLDGIANRAQRLHEEFGALQRKGSDLAGDGSKSLREADAIQFTQQLEAFAAKQESFIQETDEVLRQPVGMAAQAPQAPSLGSARLPPLGASPLGSSSPVAPGSTGGASPPPPAAGGGAFAGVSFGSAKLQTPGGRAPGFQMPPSASAFGAAMPTAAASPIGAGADGPVVTTATDQRLSAIVNKVMQQLQDFEKMKPKIGSLPEAVFMRVARQAEALDARFRSLQKRGHDMVGDGSKRMLEKDAGAYASDMEKFYSDQDAFVRETQKEIEATGAARGASSAQAPLPLGGAGGMLGSTKLPPLSPRVVG